jgi:uncharacterized protein
MDFTLVSVRPRTGWLAAGAVAGLALAVVFGPAFAPKAARAVDPTTNPEHTISVTGTGIVKIAPDVADLSVGVNITRPTVKEARAVAARQMTAVLAALAKAGIADKDVQTSGLNLNPVYDYSGNTQRLTGYTVSNTVTATIRNLDTVDDVVDGAMKAGATTMDGLTFRVDDPAAAEAQARDAAVKDARTKADALARAAGVSISGVQTIVEQTANTPQPIMYEAAVPRAASDASTPIKTGTNDVSVSVSIVYLID